MYFYNIVFILKYYFAYKSHEYKGCEMAFSFMKIFMENNYTGHCFGLKKENQ